MGLAGKVVIIDEVHAYDVFMAAHLQVLLAWLAQLQVPVIMLSATLPTAQRDAYLRAYANGDQSTGDIEAYPRITTADASGTRSFAPPPSARRSRVLVEQVADTHEAIAEQLHGLLRDGGCALVVRNTVGQARDTAAALAVLTGWDVACHHSRFMAADRAANDESLLREFGSAQRVEAMGGARPERKIVVAQVAEMSLDVDFDLLITDLAPMDSLLQRLGRSASTRSASPRSVGPAANACHLRSRGG